MRRGQAEDEKGVKLKPCNSDESFQNVMTEVMKMVQVASRKSMCIPPCYPASASVIALASALQWGRLSILRDLITIHAVVYAPGLDTAI